MPVAFEIPAAFGSAGGARAGLGGCSPRSLRISIPRTILVSHQGPADPLLCSSWAVPFTRYRARRRMAPHNKYLLTTTEVPPGSVATSGTFSALFGRMGLVCPADEGDNKRVFRREYHRSIPREDNRAVMPAKKRVLAEVRL